MAGLTVYYDVLVFVVPAGQTVTLPHNINENGLPVVPDMLYRDSMSTTVDSVTSTHVTLTNPTSSGAVNCTVMLQQFLSVERGFKDAAQTIAPRPFIVGGAQACYCQPIT